MILRLVVPVAGVVAWSAANLLIPHSPADPDLIQQPEPAILQQTSPILHAQQPAAARAALSLPIIAAAQAAPVPAAPDEPAEIVEQSEAQKEGLAQELRNADQALQPGGFGDACFEQMRAFFCPIFGQIPIAREMIGQMAVIGGFSCPTGKPTDQG